MKDTQKILAPALAFNRSTLGGFFASIEGESVVRARNAAMAKSVRSAFGASDVCVGAAVLASGRAFPVVADGLPSGLSVGEPKMCHRNARSVALCNPRYRYVEGFATPTKALPLPLPHAWLVDADDVVIDRTWDDGADYRGVVVPEGSLRAMAAFARRRRERLGFVTDWEGRRLLSAMGVTVEEAIAGL